MTTVRATVLADSIMESGGQKHRLTTFELKYPRFIHAEFMTHRRISRNAASSRAIPVKRQIEAIKADPVVPLFWGQNQKGMQAGEELDEDTKVRAKSTWLRAMDHAIAEASLLDQFGLHKQNVNRLLEPFSHITVVATATEWTNFFGLRRHKDAEPHIHLLADRMWEARQASEPRFLNPGQFHLPHVAPFEIDTLRDEDYIPSPEFDPLILTLGWKRTVMGLQLSTARCASTSYKTVDGKDMTIERALDLSKKLLSSQPLHASPAEHQATPDIFTPNFGWHRPDQHGNLVGWRQFRKMLPNEEILEYGG